MKAHEGTDLSKKNGLTSYVAVFWVMLSIVFISYIGGFISASQQWKNQLKAVNINKITEPILVTPMPSSPELTKDRLITQNNKVIEESKQKIPTSQWVTLHSNSLKLSFDYPGVPGNIVFQHIDWGENETDPSGREYTWDMSSKTNPNSTMSGYEKQTQDQCG